MNPRRLRPLAITALVLLSGAAFGQTADKAPLRGPSGDDKSVPGETRRFGGEGGGDKKDRLAKAPIRHPAFMKSLDVLRGDKAAEAVRLSPEQDDKIRTIDEGLRSKMESFRSEHGVEIRDLLAKLPPDERRKFAMIASAMSGGERPAAKGQRPAEGERPAKGERPARRPKADAPKGDAPKGDDAMMQPEVDPAQAEAARARLREIVETAPRPEDAHKEIFGVLSEAQRPLVQAEIDRIRQEYEKAGQEQGKKFQKEVERSGRKLDNKEADAAAKNQDAPTSIDDPRIPERMRERLKNLPADQQREALRRAWDRIKAQNNK